MANYVVTDTELTNVANSIREKSGTIANLSWPNEYINAINDIQTEAYAVISVIYPSGSTCTCTKGSIVLTAANTSGQYNFFVPESGTWVVSCTDGTDSDSKNATISSQYQNVDITLKYLPDIGSALNDYSWNDISKVAKAGMGDTYWDIGDRKLVNLNGTIGTLALNITLYVFILDFNHPINKTTADNNIIFGGFKTALTGGTDVALCDSKYNGPSSGKYFSMNHTSGTNSGGWKGCDLRYDVLGATSSKNSNATQTTITSPVANTLMAALPSDMRAVLRLWTHYVDNAGNSSNTDGNVTSVVDAGITLLAAYEIFGSRSWANQYEQNHQKQMGYYTAGNAKKKYKHSATSTAVFWWESSPSYDCPYAFCVVLTDGSAGYSDGGTDYSYGLAPAFKV